MKEKALKSMVAVLLIITLTMANFIALGVSAVSYAADVISNETATNNKNVTFDSYFKDENGNKVSNKEESINNDNMKLFIQVSVKNDGYFNGTISLEDSNFKLKNEVLSNGINKIEGNTITLNQINSGEAVEVEVGIEPLKDDTISSGLLNMLSNVSINGTYRNSSEKDIKITATRNVQLTLVSPYVENEGIELTSQVITNKVYPINGANKRIVQVFVESGLKDSAYPIKETNMEISVPDDVEKVEVASRGIFSTNGKSETIFNSDSWSYSETDKKVNVTIKNAEENGTIKWTKNEKDQVVITYVMSENTNVTNTEITAKSNVTLYDSKSTVKEAVTTSKISEEVDGVITAGVKLSEGSIYKGKIYSGEDRNYASTANIYVNNSETGKSIDIDLLESTYETANGEITANSQYINTTINKAEVMRILGEQGTLTISANTGAQLAQISNESETDENGNVVISYPEGTKGLKIKATAPTKTGTITLNSTKAIKKESYSRDTISSAKALVEKVTNAEAKISLQDTTSVAKLDTNKASLSTMTENTGVEIITTLKTNSEENDLYANPSIRIALPSQIEEVTVNSINLLYEEQLQIASANVHEENGIKVIEINLTGEQTKHNGEVIEGATIIVNANLTLNKKATNSDEVIKATITNQNTGATLNEEKPIQVVSPRGMVTINSIEDFGMLVIGEEETKTSKLELGAEQKESQVNIEVINNNDSKINDVKVLGDFPTKNGTNTIETSVSGLEVSGADATVYYTENEDATEDLNNNSNGWKTELSNNTSVKKYLIAVDSMETAQDLTASYTLSIPEGLQYNEEAYEGYKVTYNNSETNTSNEVTATTLGLLTGKGPELKTTLKAKLGGSDLPNGAEVAQGEVISYEINVENTGTEAAKNVNISGLVPDGTVYVEPKENYEYAEGYYNEFTDKQQATFTVDSIAAGENITKTYDVKVKKSAQTGSELTNKAAAKYGEATAESNAVSNKVREGNLSVTVKKVTDRQIELYKDGYVRYYVMVENISNTTQNNVSVKLNLPEELELSKVILISDPYGENPNPEEIEVSNNINLGSISAGETKYICIMTGIKALSGSTESGIKDVNISATATSNESKNEVRSNTYTDTVKSYKLNITLSANNENGYLKTDDIVEYTIKIENTSDVDAKLINIKDSIPQELTIQSVTVNGEEVSSNSNNITIARDVAANSTVEAKVKAMVDYDESRTEPVVISNMATLSDLGATIAQTDEISHILQADSRSSENGGDVSSKNMISGTAWLDENQDGQRDSSEQLMEGISVKLVDTAGNTAKNESGEDITAVTNNNGLYMLTGVPQGQYLVVFNYDTSVYAATAYQKEGVPETKNSDVIVKQLTVDGQEGTYGVTDAITMTEEGVSSVDLGLIAGSKFDLELNKYISKIVVQNSKGTQTYEYDKATIAKAEIAAKQLQGSTVVIEYQIEVKNTGEVAGYAKSIVDYMPSSLKFNSELNTDWYQSENDLYNTSLANTKLEPGEAKTVSLTLTKTMTEENTGLVNNTAEIAESYNESGLIDVDSTAGNKQQGEDDMGSADVIISVKTGAMITYIGLTISVIMLMGVGAYFVNRRINKNNNIEVNL